MTQQEAITKASGFLASALEANDLSDSLHEQGNEDESIQQSDRAVLHSNLAIALMLVHGIVFVSNQGG